MLAPVREIEGLSVSGKRKKGRPRITQTDYWSLDMANLNFTGDMTLGRIAWRRSIKIDETSRDQWYKRRELFSFILDQKFQLVQEPEKSAIQIGVLVSTSHVNTTIGLGLTRTFFLFLLLYQYLSLLLLLLFTFVTHYFCCALSLRCSQKQRFYSSKQEHYVRASYSPQTLL